MRILTGMKNTTTTARIIVQTVGTNFGAIAYITIGRSRKRVYETAVRSQRHMAYADALAHAESRGWTVA